MAERQALGRRAFHRRIATKRQQTARHHAGAGMSPTDRVLPLLRGLKETAKREWVACCPAHDDKRPSMTVRETDDGRLLMHCFADCATADILAALGLQFSD